MANRGIRMRYGLRMPQSPNGWSERRRDTSIDELVVGLLVPINGSAGIWGPSAIACAQLAQVEINGAGGLLERAVRLHVIDASDEAVAVGGVTADLMEAGAIDAIVGMHTSQVRERVLHDLELQMPYIYTPLYEGGEMTPGVFAIGLAPFDPGTDLFLLALVIYDGVTLRHLHPATLWGGSFLVVMQVLRVALMDTGAWLAVASWLTR